VEPPPAGETLTPGYPLEIALRFQLLGHAVYRRFWKAYRLGSLGTGHGSVLCANPLDDSNAPDQGRLCIIFFIHCKTVFINPNYLIID
jgi:hypothetical protein